MVVNLTCTYDRYDKPRNMYGICHLLVSLVQLVGPISVTYTHNAVQAQDGYLPRGRAKKTRVGQGGDSGRAAEGKWGPGVLPSASISCLSPP